jgi:hypothetical protein
LRLVVAACAAREKKKRREDKNDIHTHAVYISKNAQYVFSFFFFE